MRYRERQVKAACEFERGLQDAADRTKQASDPNTMYDSGMTDQTQQPEPGPKPELAASCTGYRFTDFEVGEDLYLVHLAAPRRPDRSALMPVRVTQIERDVTEWAFPNWESGDKIWVTRSPFIQDAATYTYIVTSTHGPLWRFEDARTAVFRARVREDLAPAEDEVWEWLEQFTPTQLYLAAAPLGLDLERAWAEYSRTGPVQWVDVAALLAAAMPHHVPVPAGHP